MSSTGSAGSGGSSSPPGTPPYDAAARRAARAQHSNSRQNQTAATQSVHATQLAQGVLRDQMNMSASGFLDLPNMTPGGGGAGAGPGAGAGGAKRGGGGGGFQGIDEGVPMDSADAGSVGGGSVSGSVGGGLPTGSSSMPSTMIPNKRMSAGTIEQARRFLWEDDDAYHPDELTLPPGAGEQEAMAALMSGPGGPSLTSRNMDWGEKGGGGTNANSGAYPWASPHEHLSSLDGGAAGGGGGFGGVGQRAPPSHGSQARRNSGDEVHLGHFPRPHEIDSSGTQGNGVFRAAGRAISSTASSLINTASQMIPKSSPTGGRDEQEFSRNIAPRKGSMDMTIGQQRALRSSAFAPPRKLKPWDGCLASLGMCANTVLYFLSTYRRPLLVAAAAVALIVGTAVAIAANPQGGNPSAAQGNGNSPAPAPAQEDNGESSALDVGAPGPAQVPAPARPESSGAEEESAAAASGAAEIDPSQRLNAMQTSIVESKITDAGAFDDLDSPQSRALRWLVTRDGKQLEPQDEYLLQRYALAVFYYSASTPSSLAATPFEEGQDRIMDEFAQEDRGTQEEDSEDDRIHGWTYHDGWLTDRGYCSWRGVECHHRAGTQINDTTFDDDYGVTHLNLTNNAVYGTIPSELSALAKDLRVLDLGDNQIMGEIPTRIGELTELVTLDLANNDLTGTLPTELGQLVKCTHLLLDRNIIGPGPVPSQIGNMASLHSLSLYENYLTGQFPLIQEMNQLRALYLDDNDFEGTLPRSVLASLTNMEDMRLGTNNFTGPLPTELGLLTKVTKLFLDYNEFTGIIPTEIGGMTLLGDLHLHQNHFEGSIPASLGDLKELEVLYLDHNELTSAIPPEIGGCENLEELFLQSNALTGVIPDGLLDVGESLIGLHLDSNALVGPIPADIGDRLSGLERLRLNGNALTGNVPKSLANMENLEEARLQENELNGAVPEGVCALRDTEGGALEVLQADCEGDERKVACACCTDCF